MNAAGLTFLLFGVSKYLDNKFVQKLVTNGSISQGELDGTRKNLAQLVATLKRTPPEKIEAMMAKFDEELTMYVDKFNHVQTGTGGDLLSGFKDAQLVAGYVTTIMAKSGIRD